MYFNPFRTTYNNQSSGFPTRSDTNWAVQPQNVARGLKFRILEVDGLYYLYSENKGADQLRIYCAADLRLCFRICKNHLYPYGARYEKTGFLHDILHVLYILTSHSLKVYLF